MDFGNAYGIDGDSQCVAAHAFGGEVDFVEVGFEGFVALDEEGGRGDGVAEFEFVVGGWGARVGLG